MPPARTCVPLFVLLATLMSMGGKASPQAITCANRSADQVRMGQHLKAKGIPTFGGRLCDAGSHGNCDHRRYWQIEARRTPYRESRHDLHIVAMVLSASQR